MRMSPNAVNLSMIRHMRKLRKISQDTMSAITGINPTYLSQMENRRLNPTMEELKAIGTALDWPFDIRDLVLTYAEFTVKYKDDPRAHVFVASDSIVPHSTFPDC